MVEVATVRSEAGFAGPEAGIPLQKKGLLGSLQKKNFRPFEKDGFFADFENRQKTFVSVNKDDGLVNSVFFVFGPNWVKNRVKKISCQTYGRLQICRLIMF